MSEINCNDISKFRVFLRKYIYNQMSLNLLSNHISQNIDVKNIKCNYTERKIIINIKKNKKNNNLNIIDYYPLLDHSIYNFLCDINIKDEIQNCVFSSSLKDREKELLKNSYIKILSGENVRLLYNATIIQDAIILFL